MAALKSTDRYKGLDFVSNDTTAIVPWRREKIIPISMPILASVWQAIQRATGYRWRSTSFIRRSPSHQKGHSLDLVPDMDPELTESYSGTHRSDPILHSRLELIDALLPLTHIKFSNDADVVIAVESDHLHLQVVKIGSQGPFPTNILRWQTLKPVYADTVERNAKTAHLRSGPVE